MSLVATFTRDSGLAGRLAEALEPRHDVGRAASWHGFRRLVRERPVVASIVDLDVLASVRSGRDTLAELRSAYPRLGLVLVVRPSADPLSLFHLGRAGIENLVFLSVEELRAELNRGMRRALETSAAAIVTRSLSPFLPRRALMAVHQAMEGVHRRWGADAFAEAVGLSRPFLSEVFKERGLPSVGHLLLWTRLLHAGLWLSEPGRTAESVSRQLEYSSGAAFRRALKHYTGATPTQVIERGGLPFVLRRFQSACGFVPAREARPTVA